MALAPQELFSGGEVRDQDGRLCVVLAPDAGFFNLQFGVINTAASGQTQLVAAQSTQKIKVVSYVIVATTAVTVQFQSGSTALTGALPIAANGGVVCPGLAGASWFETAVNQALNINLGAAVQVSGHFGYFLQ